MSELGGFLIKRILFLLTSAVGMVAVVLFATSLLSEDVPPETGEIRPHLMVNDQLYWSSAHPPGHTFLDGNFTCIGEVEKEVHDTPTRNFHAYGIPEGIKVYYDCQFPQILYLDLALVPVRYATVEASKDYLYHDETVYVSLTTCGWERESYVNDYKPLYGEEITVDPLPEDSIYIGDTSFAGYNMFVHEELETNASENPMPVYQDRSNSNLLYVGEYHWIYVPLIQPLSEDWQD